MNIVWAELIIYRNTFHLWNKELNFERSDWFARGKVADVKAGDKQNGL